MIFRFNILVLAFSLCCSATLFSQRSSDLGIIFSRNTTGNVGLEYRHAILEKSKLSVGLFYGSYNSYFNSSNSKIISASDSVIIERKYHSAHDGVSLRIGYEKEIINMFSIGGNVLFDYQRSFLGSNDSFRTKDVDGQWSNSSQYSYTSIYSGTGSNDSTWAGVYHHYIKPGIQAFVSMNIPLGDRFLLNLSMACAMQQWFFISDSRKHDPNDEFKYVPNSRFSFDTRLNLGLRYKFGVGKGE